MDNSNIEIGNSILSSPTEISSDLLNDHSNINKALNISNILFNLPKLTNALKPCSPFSNSRIHQKLRAQQWNDPRIYNELQKSNCSLQKMVDSSGAIKYDEYKIVIDSMPVSTTPEQYLSEMANDLNRAVGHEEFDEVNKFVKSTPSEEPMDVGTIFDIDIYLFDNGSVITVERTSDYFTFQTITTPYSRTGSHPENGARQFGFERDSNGKVIFYTRGVSQAEIQMFDNFGKEVQDKGWTALVVGIGLKLKDRGGSVDFSTVSIKKCEQIEKSPIISPSYWSNPLRKL